MKSIKCLNLHKLNKHYHINSKRYLMKKRNIHQYMLNKLNYQNILNIQLDNLNKKFLINIFKQDMIYIQIMNLNHMIHMQNHKYYIIHYIKFQEINNWYIHQHLNKLNNLNYSFNIIHYLDIYQTNMKYKLLNYYKIYILQDKLNMCFHQHNILLDMKNSIMNSKYKSMMIHMINNQLLNLYKQHKDLYIIHILLIDLLKFVHNNHQDMLIHKQFLINKNLICIQYKLLRILHIQHKMNHNLNMNFS